MPAQITNFQCPACTGPLHFDGSTGKLRCDYCGSTFTVQEIEALYGEKIESAQQAAAAQAVTPEAQNEQAGGEGAPEGWDWNAVSDDWGTAGVNMRAYSCPSCGAELICDATTVATQCPYCGNPTVVLSQFDGNLKPDYILPFKLDKEAAIAALKDFYKDKKLLPRQFASNNQIEKIQGVYVPFWLFNGTVEVDMDFSASRSMTHREGDRIITETDHFRLRRAGDVDFERIPVDVKADNIDMLSSSAHKFHGPKGTGFLYCKKGIQLSNLIEGGAQERGKRAGTENVPGIAAMATALKEMDGKKMPAAARLTKLRDRLIEGLQQIPHSALNGDAKHRLPGNVNFCFEGIEGESLLLLLDDKGIMASSGSACTSGSLDPSHVLLAIGRIHDVAHGSLRLTLGEENTEEEVEYIIKSVKEVVEYLRGFSPVWRELMSGEREFIL